MADYPINHHLYTYLWNKYRPMILKLMVDSAKEPQEYKFQQHEFRDINPKEKGGYWFTLVVFKGKSQTDIRKSVVAQDLLIILQRSGKALELTETTQYQFVMDKQFVLHITSEEIVAKEEVTDEPSTTDVSEVEKDIKEEVKEEVVKETKQKVKAEK